MRSFQTSEKWSFLSIFCYYTLFPLDFRQVRAWVKTTLTEMVRVSFEVTCANAFAFFKV